MITVRFPTGVAIRYNSANYVARSANFTDIYVCKDGTWIAQVPNACVIEVQPPCRVYNPAREPEEALDAVLDDIEKRRHALPVHKLADLKAALQAFNARSREWK